MTDINVLQGVYPAKPIMRSLPGLCQDVYIGGNEGYGIIEEVAAGGESDLKIGDWVVFGRPQMGTWSSHMNCNEKDIIKIDRRDNTSLTPVMASTLQVNPATAYRMLTDFQNLNKGDVIIQNAANSAVGQAVIQIASRKMGVTTINLVRNRPDLKTLKTNLSKLGSEDAPAHVYEDLESKKLGAKEEIKKILGERKIKLGLNALCGMDTSNMAKVMGSGSTIVTYGAMSKQPFSIPASLLIFQNFTIKGFMMNQWYANNTVEERRKLMMNLAQWYEEGSLQPPPAKIVEFNPKDSVDKITKKAREAIHQSMEGFGSQKMFFRFV